MMSEGHGIYEIKVINGKKHLIEKGVPSDFDHGVLHKNPLTGKWETNNPVGENFSFDDESGLWQRNEKFGVEKSNGEKGTMERRHRIFDESDYHYEKEKKRKGDISSRIPDWLMPIWWLIWLDWIILLGIVKGIIKLHNKFMPHLSSYLHVDFRNISIWLKISLKILDVGIMYLTMVIFDHLSAPITSGFSLTMVMILFFLLLIYEIILIFR